MVMNTYAMPPKQKCLFPLFFKAWRGDQRVGGEIAGGQENMHFQCTITVICIYS